MISRASRGWTIIALALLIGAGLGYPSRAGAGGDPFPAYPWLAKNVTFWSQVYGRYPSSQGLIHDSQNLGVIYQVVTLSGGTSDSEAARLANERQIEAVKGRYRRLLLALAAGQPSGDPEERRVRALFGPGAKAGVFAAAADQIRFQRCLKDRFMAGVIRSGRYLGQIRAIFRRYQLPEDLAYLPHVESSFNYQAYSKSGAAGIWQLIPETGRRFLRIGPGIDERRDPIAATQAAAQVLKLNHEKLGSWPLALTAYNHGLNSMLRAKGQYGDFAGVWRRYDDPRFGFASRNFYAEFLAARELAKNYRRHFHDLRPLPPLPASLHTLTAATSLAELSRRFKVRPATLAALNPALLPPVLTGKEKAPKGYRLRLPSKPKPRQALVTRRPGRGATSLAIRRCRPHARSSPPTGTP